MTPTSPHHPETPADPTDSPLPDDPDVRLVEDIRCGQPDGWSTLIKRYQDRLFSVCLRLVHDRELAADLTQDAFVKVIQGLDKYDGRSKLSTWMIRVTMNVCLSKLRSEKLRRHASLDAMAAGNSDREGGGRGAEFEAPEPRTREHGTGSGVIEQEDRRLVLQALQLLEADQRAVLILRDAQDLEYEQIAEVLGVAVGTVKSRLFRARAALRNEMEKLGAGMPDDVGGSPKRASGGET